MNLKEHCLDEIELHTSLVKEGIGCLLHTILTIRDNLFVRKDFELSSNGGLLFSRQAE